MSPSCVECGKPTEGVVVRGMGRDCYQRLRRQGTLDEHPRRLKSSTTIEAEIETYYELIEDGLTPLEACGQIGVNDGTMQTRLASRGLSMLGRVPKRNYLGSYDELIENYWILRANGNDMTMTEIAKKLDVSVRTLHRALAKVR